MLTEICKWLWLNPYEITEICLEKNDDSELTVVCIQYRTAPSLITTKRYDLEDEVAALEEAKRIAELVNKFYEPESSPDYHPNNKYQCNMCRRGFNLDDSGIFRGNRWVCYLCEPKEVSDKPSSDEPLKYENYVCMRCSESKSFGDYPPDAFSLGGDGILRGKEDELICFDCIDAEEDDFDAFHRDNRRGK